MEIELRSGAMDDAAREILAQLLRIDELAPHADRRARVDARAGRRPTRRLSASTPPSTPSSPAGNYMDAAAMLQEFVTRVSGQIGALLKLVEICVDGGLEATMYESAGDASPTPISSADRAPRPASSPKTSSRASRGSTRTSSASAARW